MSRAEFREALP